MVSDTGIFIRLIKKIKKPIRKKIGFFIFIEIFLIYSVGVFAGVGLLGGGVVGKLGTCIGSIAFSI